MPRDPHAEFHSQCPDNDVDGSMNDVTETGDHLQTAAGGDSAGQRLVIFLQRGTAHVSIEMQDGGGTRCSPIPQTVTPLAGRPSSRLIGMENQTQLVKILRDLASTCRDAEEGFNKAAKGVHNDEYRAIFDKLSVERAAFASEWDELLRQNGSEPGDQGHAGGPARAGWVELETRIRPKDDSEIVQQAGDR